MQHVRTPQRVLHGCMSNGTFYFQGTWYGSSLMISTMSRAATLMHANVKRMSFAKNTLSYYYHSRRMNSGTRYSSRSCGLKVDVHAGG